MHYSGLGDPARWSLIEALIEQGGRQPEALWYQDVDGERLSFGTALEEVRRTAGYFTALGVRKGDMVAVMLPNGANFVRAWLGLGMLGAVAALLNTELRGSFLQHQLANCGARLAVVDAEFLPTVIAAAAGSALQRVLVAGAAPAAGAPEQLPFDAWRSAAAWDGPRPAPQDTFCVMYTSGTTGPAKGVLMPHAHCTLFGIGALESVAIRPTDRYYIVLPLFHSNGLLMQLGATLLAGIPAIVRRRFSASAWLGDIRAHGATITNLLGALAAFVLAQPPSPDDRRHSLRVVKNAPNVPAHEAQLRARFAVPDVVSGFGMTEVNIPVWGRIGHSRPGAAGWVHTQHFELIIADPNTDCELPRGEVGEILVRPKVPFGFMTGYHAMPDKTVEAWLNLWFHTGDAATMDAEGVVTFIDRIKDCIRRRGENISATEVESAVATLPGIGEIAACAVPSDIPGGEDEILLSVVPAAGAKLVPQAITSHADQVLPRFARVRYVEIVTELPKTASGKVQRAALRQRGHAGAWDRDANEGVKR
jgi:crotonobetaine/carnitine-CoA ligase